MAVLSLKVSVVERGVVKTMQFDPSTVVYDACKIIRDKMPEANLGNPKEYGLFLADDDPKKGVWMEPGKSLEYYLVRAGDLLEYKKKVRTLKVRMMDGAVKTLMVDDSQPVGQLLVVVCTRIGITNHEEYSLVRENSLPEIAAQAHQQHQNESRSSTLKKQDAISTLTLGRSKEKKMEQLRKQLHTDEEINWVDHSKTLREQGIEETETLLLRRKFFFSDQNIDARDPIQLNLLYVQCRDGILDGTHPVAKEEAFKFAGLQCQIQFGDYVDTKQRSVVLDLHEFLPKEYIKTKDAEKRILTEYRNCKGLSELDAKVEYVRRCRSLKTYGVTFFLVKEKLKGKNKLVPRLLGVNKDCVMRVDERTKEVLKVYPLETVRRWAASPNTFTLDFGDYQDSYYSVQTAEGEKIAQLIAGYIDIILRKKKAKDHFGIEGDEGSTMLEDIVAPAKATLMSHGAFKEGYAEEGSVALPGILRPGATGEIPYGAGSLQRAQYGAIGGYVATTHVPSGQQPKIFDTLSGNKAQRALLGTIEASIKTIEKAEEDLKTKADLPDLGAGASVQKWKETQMVVEKQQVSDHLAAMGAATAQVVQLTGAVPDQVDHTAVGAAISTISSNIPDVTKGVKTIAALMEDEDRGDRLLDAARKLCGAVSDLLGSVNPERLQPRQTVLAAAGRVGDYSHEMIETIEEPSDQEKQFQDILVQLAKQVATSTAQLVMRAKTVSGQCADQPLQDRVIHSATQCAFATSQLVACTRVVAPTIDSPACQEQLIDAAKQVARSVEQLLKDAELACKEEKSLGDLREAAAEVSRRLNDLLNHIKTGPERARVTEHDRRFDDLLTSTDKFLTYQGSANEMLRQVKVLAEATTHLVTHIRGEAETQQTEEESQRLVGAARQLADATTRMIEAAKTCATSPQEARHQVALKAAAEDLRTATSTAARDHLLRQAVQNLEKAARRVVAGATQTVAAAHACEPSSRSPENRDNLARHCKDVADLLPRVISAVKQSTIHQESIVVRTELITVCRESLQPCGRLTNAGRAAVPTVGDQYAATQLTRATHELSESLAELRTTLTKISAFEEESSGIMELGGAISTVRRLDEELIEYEIEYRNGRLRPLPGETADGSASNLVSSTKSIGSSMAQLLSAAAQGDEQYAGASASHSADGLRHLTSAVRGVCSTRPPDPQGGNLIASARDVMEKSILLYEEAQTCLRHPDRPDNQQRLAQVAKAVTFSLNRCVSYLPGQQDIDSTIESVSQLLETISASKLPPTYRNHADIRQDLLRLANDLQEAANRLAASVGGPPYRLAEAVEHYQKILRNFVTVVLEIAYIQQDALTREQIIDALRTLVRESVHFLKAVKASSVDPGSLTAKQQLTSSNKTLTESIYRLVDLCTSGAPWQKECENALRSIQMMYRLLENPTEPANDFNYFDCLDAVTEESRKLGDGMTGIAHNAKNGELDLFCHSIREVTRAVCRLAESASQAAYLVGVADSQSVPGTPGLLDVARFNESVNVVRRSCERIESRRFSQSEVLEAATQVARHTSTLANMCRDASSKSQNASAKKHFINCARDVACTTANLIKAIKTLDGDFSEPNKLECARTTQPLLQALDNLSSFVVNPEFAGVPARISANGFAKQQPILTSGRRMLDGACDIIRTAQSLASNARDQSLWQQLANHSKTVSDSIKSLVAAIRDEAPGQQECDRAIERITHVVKILDHAAIAAVTQNLPPRRDNTEKGFHEQVDNSAQQILDRVEGIRAAAKREAENLGHRVSEISNYFDSLADACIGAATLTLNSKRQVNLLDQCKTAAEAQLQLLYGAKDSGGNPKALEFHAVVDESSEDLRVALKDLLKTIGEAVSEAGVVSTMIAEISRAIAKTDEQVSGEGVSYADYQTRMIHCCKEINRIAQEMVSKSYANCDELGQLAFELSKNYAQLAEDTPYVCAAASGPDVAQRIRGAVQELGTACIELVKNAGVCRCNPDDQFAKRDLGDAARLTAEKVNLVLAALQAGARGTQACINAASTVSGIIGDLDTTIMFATAGSLHPDIEGECFSDRRDAILKTAKALVEDTKALVAGAASSQEQLAVAAQNAVRTIVQLSEVVKLGAAALTAANSEAQVLVINAVKDVAAALSCLIQATKNASGKSFNDPAMNALKEAAKVMVTNVTSLLKTVKTVEDEHQRGTRALESAIEAIEQEIRAYDSTEPASNRPVKPEDLLRYTRPVTDATAKTVAAAQSCRQDDVIAASNYARKVVSDLLSVTKSAAFSAESPDVRYRCLDAGRDVAIKVRELLQSLHTVLQKPSQETREALRPASRAIARAVTDLVAYGEILKGSDWVDPADPTVVAENELLGAANSIEAAARKLASLQPRTVAGREADATLNFDEQILEAAKSIAAAVAALVKAASAAQRELVAQGRVESRPRLQTEDYQWSEGLISAARMVAAATHSLCEAANALVQGHASEEKLISAAKQVAASTAHLLVACKVKADMNSKAMQRLQAAGNAVKVATEHLVRAAKQAIDAEDERTLIISQRMVSGIAQVLDAQEEVLRKEKELEEARVRLAAIRKAKYKERPAGATSSREGSPETPYYSDF